MVRKRKRLDAKSAALVLNSAVDTSKVYTYKEIRNILSKFLGKNTIAIQVVCSLLIKEEIFTKIGNPRHGIHYIPNRFPVFYRRIQHWYVEADKKCKLYRASKPQPDELQILYKQKEEIENKIKQYLVAHNLL